MIVDLAAHVGARRNEIIAPTWDDIDFAAKTLTINKAVEDTVAYGRHIKEPKTAEGRRVIGIDAALVERLQAYRDAMKRQIAGIETGADVDLGLIKMPRGYLLFPGRPEPARRSTIPNSVTVTRCRGPSRSTPLGSACRTRERLMWSISLEATSWSQQIRWFPGNDWIGDDEGGYLVATCGAKADCELMLPDKAMLRDFKIPISVSRARNLERTRQTLKLPNDAIGYLSYSENFIHGSLELNDENFAVLWDQVLHGKYTSCQLSLGITPIQNDVWTDNPLSIVYASINFQRSSPASDRPAVAIVAKLTDLERAFVKGSSLIVTAIIIACAVLYFARH